MKLWYQSKTLWLNIIGLLVVCLEAYQQPEAIVYTAPVIIMLNGVLRLMTKEGVGFKVKG